ncbi:MAG: trehalose-phosphatase [Candidatus Omnitrophica bacterium]|nr:trehalose-phosphatase [Candidatus Omnitrophota bacterium]
MKHLFATWEEVYRRIKDRYLVLFLDYDGTLVPMMPRPDMAKLTARKKTIIEKLSKQTDIKVVVISGRELKDVKKCVGIPEIVYAGNHGLELEDPQIKHIHPAAVEFEAFVRKLVDRLKRAYTFLPEILIEGKTFSVSVHYRQVPEKKIELAKMILLKEIGGYLGQSQVGLTEGKKVWEIRPPVAWNKGHTVTWLFGRIIAHIGERALPIYIGDDLTDEDAFRALKHRGITIKVVNDPREETAARYYLLSPNDAFEFLRRLIKMKEKETLHVRTRTHTGI